MTDAGGSTGAGADTSGPVGAPVPGTTVRGGTGPGGAGLDDGGFVGAGGSGTVGCADASGVGAAVSGPHCTPVTSRVLSHSARGEPAGWSRSPAISTAGATATLATSENSTSA
ncbi:MAG TPA: hypothetical protein VM367_17185 [Pseudonocardia sp.]|nr:hypothetical protein [Pseudonocardia sp.]